MNARPFWLTDWLRLLAWPAVLIAIVALAFSLGRSVGFEVGVRAADCAGAVTMVQP